MSLVMKLAQAAAEEHHDVDDLQEHTAQHVAPQDRVAEQVDEGQPVAGRQVRAAARPRRPGSSSSVEAISNASVPSAAPSGDSVTVERNSAIAATPEHRQRSRSRAPAAVRPTSCCGRQRGAGDAGHRRAGACSLPSSSDADDVRRRRHHQHGQHTNAMTRPAWRPAAGSARPAGPAGSAACPLRLAGDRRPRRRPRPRSAGTAAARSPARRAGTACRRSAPRTGTPGPVPGRGPRSVTASSTATSVGRASSSAIVTQVRRPPEQLDQLDPDHGRADPVRASVVASSTTCSRSVARRRASSPGRRPAPAGR